MRRVILFCFFSMDEGGWRDLVDFDGIQKLSEIDERAPECGEETVACDELLRIEDESGGGS